MTSAKQLFHAIVIVGAALTASCGDDDDDAVIDAQVAFDSSIARDTAVPRDAGADARQDAMVIIL